MNPFDKDFFSMTTGFAVIVVSMLVVISYIGSQLPETRQRAAPAAVEQSFATTTDVRKER